MIPEKSQGKVLQATVVAVGPGATNKVFIISKMFVPFCAERCLKSYHWLFFPSDWNCHACQC